MLGEMDTIATEQYTEEVMKSGTDSKVGWDESNSSGFDCNICLDFVEDPVVTLCGHLFCWPCIYKWLHFQTDSDQLQQQQQQQQCPVCKAQVSEGTLVPLFGRGQTTKPSKSKAPNLGIIIPGRPLGVACGYDSPRSSHSPQQSRLYYSPTGTYASPHVTTWTMSDPMVGMLGEMIYARAFGDSLTNIYSYPDSYNLARSASPRLRRHVMQADKSLSRICFFLFCCVFLCFLLF